MRCPSCSGPMEMSRHEPGKFKVFTCNRCRATRKREVSPGYSGQLVMSPKVDVRHQEKG